MNDDDSDGEPESLQYKVILIGDGTVGKTSIAMRFTDDSFNKRCARDVYSDNSLQLFMSPLIYVFIQLQLQTNYWPRLLHQASHAPGQRKRRCTGTNLKTFACFLSRL